MQKYSFDHTDAFRRVNPSDVIILEGILVCHDPRVREMMMREYAKFVKPAFDVQP